MAFYNGTTRADIPAGTSMLFYQASAPTGWTQYTGLDDYALRITSGSGAGTGGTSAFSTVFQNQAVTVGVSGGVSGSVGATTLGINEMPSHNHSITIRYEAEENYGQGIKPSSYLTGSVFTSVNTGATGGNGAHSHGWSGSFSGSGTSSAVTLNVRYANVIICTKN